MEGENRWRKFGNIFKIHVCVDKLL